MKAVGAELKGQKWIAYWLAVMLSLIPVSTFGFVGPFDTYLKPAWLAGTILILSFIYFSLKCNFSFEVFNFHKIVFLLLTFASFVTAYEIILNEDFGNTTITQMLRLLWVLLLFLVISSIKLKIKNVNKVFKTWITLIALIAGYNLYVVVVTNTGYPGLVPITASSEASVSYLGDYRRPAAIIEPSRFCQYTLSPLLASFMILFLGSDHDKLVLYEKGYINYALFVVIFIGYVTTMSLGGIIVLSLVLLSIILTSSKYSLKGKLKYLTIIAVITAFASSILYYSAGINIVYISYVRMYTLVGEISGYPSIIPDAQYAETSFRARMVGVKRTFNVILENPVSGAGLGNLTIMNVESLSLSDSARGVHSGIMQLTAELGLIGLILFISLYYKIFRSVLRFSTSSIPAENIRILVHAFAFILFARLVYIFGAGNWINMVVWADMSIPLLLINSYKSRMRDL